LKCRQLYLSAMDIGQLIPLNPIWVKAKNDCPQSQK